MRITFLKAGGWGNAGGDRVIATHAQNLKDMGHEVTVVTSRYPNPTVLDKLRYIKTHRRLFIDKQHELGFFQNTTFKKVLLDTFRPIEARDIPDGDAVIATWWETAEWLAKFPKSKGTPFFFIQGYEKFDYTPHERVDEVWRSRIHKIVVSEWLAHIARSCYGDDDISKVPNSVDHKKFWAKPRSKQSVPTLGMLTHQAPFKGTAIGFEVVRRLAERMPRLIVQAFGHGRVDFDFPANVDFTHHGALTEHGLRSVYSACDVWLNTSSSEGFGLPILEAMACRCPVVSTRVGAATDLITPNVNGFAVDIGDIASLASRAEHILTSDPEAWIKMSSAAFSRTVNYDWRAATKLLESVIIERIGPAALDNCDSAELLSDQPLASSPSV